jgi:hypothetical protein
LINEIEREKENMRESERLFGDATELRTRSVEYSDKAFLSFIIAMATAVLGGFIGLVVFMGWYIDTSMGGRAASAEVQWSYAGILTLAAVMLAFIGVTVWQLFVARRKRLSAMDLHTEAQAVEKEELEILRQKAERKKMAEAAEAHAAAAQRVAKAVQETRDERRVERTDGKNKPGGSAGRVKEV